MATLSIGIGLVTALTSPASGRIAGDDALVVTPDYRLRAIRWYHQQVRVLAFEGGTGVQMKSAIPYPTMSGRSTVSAVGTRNGAVAAVNGDFKYLDTDAPRHLTMIDGEIWTTGVNTQRGYSFQSTADGSRAWIGRTVPEITATQGETTFPITAWNAEIPSFAHVVAFTRRGGRLALPVDPDVHGDPLARRGRPRTPSHLPR